MKRLIWTLHIDPAVTAYTYTLRGTEAGQKLRESIIGLQFEQDPSDGCETVPERTNRYIFTVANHKIMIEIRPDEKIVRVLTIEGTS